MIQTAVRRWHRTLTGFPGIGGISWLSSVMTSRAPSMAEDLTPQEIAGPNTRYLSVGGHQVAYTEQGEGEKTVVLLHGFGGRYETWGAVQPALAARYRTISLDLWGFGASARPEGLTPRDWVREVYGTLDQLNVRDAVFAGHSLGGRVALMCAAADPARVRGLFLCDADWGQMPHGYLMAWGITRSPLFPLAMDRLRTDIGHTARLMRMVYGRNFAMHDDLVTLYHQALRVRGTLQCLSSVGQAPPFRDLRGLGRRLRCPATVVWGADDVVIPPEFAAPLARRLNAGAPLILPDCGHFPQEECPETVTAELLRFIERCG